MTASLAQKLQIKSGLVLTVINVPPDMKNRLPLELPDNPLKFELAAQSGAVLVFVTNRIEVEQIAIPLLTGKHKPALVWLAYPKGTSGVETDINRDILWKMLEPQGWRPARMIALDDTWSCMRFSPMVK
jgi:hypothetical protein